MGLGWADNSYAYSRIWPCGHTPLLSSDHAGVNTNYFNLLLTFTKITCTCFSTKITSMHKEISSKDNAGFVSSAFKPSTIPTAKERDSSQSYLLPFPHCPHLLIGLMAEE